MTLGRQAELFDPTGHAVFTPEIPRVEAVRESRRVVPVPQTIVTVQSRSKTTARVVATTRSATSTRVSAVTKTAKASRGSVARHLVMSQSISSGKEEARWFSVPQRVLLPRYQLFEGAPAVTEEQGQLRIGSPCLRTQRGRVWFV
ncbi:MAG: hypothetical protein LBN38_08115 [Verrucomicrobiota bacterium]|nr:hypothetical protein [Verrucomicrobiota bacterium]